jgi:hypothetical protein
MAQDDHKIEGPVDYSYVHANPQNNNIIPTFSLNGGGGSVAYYFTKLIGIEGEFEGYGSYTHNFTVPPPYCNGPCAVSAQNNLFTYNVGSIVNSAFRISNHLSRRCSAALTAIFTESLHCLHGIWLSDLQQVPQQ